MMQPLICTKNVLRGARCIYCPSLRSLANTSAICIALDLRAHVEFSVTMNYLQRVVCIALGGVSID
jgi:hypothetical protein